MQGKYFQIASLLLLVLVATISCGNSQKSNTLLSKTFNDSSARVMLQYPNTWVYDSSLAKFKEDLEGEGDVFQESITMGAEIIPPGFPLKEYSECFCMKYKLLDSNFKIEKDEVVNINNTKAHKIIFSTQNNDLQYKNQLLIAIKDSFGYFVQCNALQTSFDKHQPLFNDILQTFKAY
jgi:hypothetical protein